MAAPKPKPKPVEKRNVVVLGKTGTGKSTVGNKISGSSKFEVAQSCVGAGTRETIHCEATLEDRNTKYDFKIIDTVGLFDTSPTDDRQSNEKILKRLKKYFNEIVPEGISLVLFVFRKGKYTPEEEATFKFITENFRDDISKISALIITHCENEDEEVRKEIIDDFRNKVPETAKFMEKGIYAVGFPDISRLIPQLRRILQAGIEKDTEQLRDLVKKSAEMRLSKKLFEPTYWEKLAGNYSKCTIL